MITKEHIADEVAGSVQDVSALNTAEVGCSEALAHQINSSQVALWRKAIEVLSA